MEKYKYNRNGNIVLTLDKKAIGMCNRTMGCTLVVYKAEDGDGTLLVMEHKEFHEYFTKL
jgi:hypothetical protein